MTATASNPPRRAPMTHPNLFFVGAPKAGTTSMVSWLASHPDVFWSTPKEPYYFAADFPRQREHYGFSTREAYLALYAAPEAADVRYRGDGSTTYLYSDVAVPAILAAQPAARFIVAVRNPAELLPSYHRTQVVALNEDRRDFEAAWRGALAGESPGTTPLDPFLIDYPRVGRQGEALQALLAQVPRHQVQVVLFDDLRRDPLNVWLALAEGLGLDPAQVRELPTRNTSAKQARYPRLRRLTHRPPALAAGAVARARQWSRTTRTPGVGRLKASLWSTAPPPDIGPALTAELSEFFAEDTLLLSNLLGRDLSSWTPTSSA